MTTVPAVRPRIEDHPLLAGHDEAPALISRDRTVSHGELRSAVEARRRRLGGVRRLVLLELAPDLDSVTTYLAALAGGHPVLVTAPGDVERHRELVRRYDPDVVQRYGDRGPTEIRPGTAHDLHPDLALLLSTSGSTGSPKLVRLSVGNLVENARSIAAYLQIRAEDRAISSLPLHYCYGLSVLNSHLLAGAAVVLTDLSVADRCFWDLADHAGVTGIAGVPYTFELLESSGFDSRELPPTLRYLTQAGGRMDPERVVAWAERGGRRGFDLFVMYGQTEATARMAYLPPEHARQRPTSIGVPIPRGELRLAPVDGCGPDVGELVYTGPNVMLGYAHGPEDLGLGRTVAELRTGDLARRAPDGLWEVVGRLNRFAKVFGLRLDLERLEADLAGQGHPVRLVADDRRLWVFTARPRSVGRLAGHVARSTGLPAGAVRVVRIGAVPHTPSGKVDYAALRSHADLLAAEPAPGDDAGCSPERVRDLYAELLGRPDATTAQSFVDLGGDSLSYVEASVRLGAMLGTLPPDWPALSADRLAGHARERPRRLAAVETSVLLRAMAIVAIVATHADVVQVMGGAHVLLTIAGFNLARFQLAVAGRTARVRSLLGAAGAVAVPAVAWIGAVTLVTGEYRPATPVLLNQLLGSDTWTVDWQFWFLEVLVWGLGGLALLLLVPGLDRAQRRWPFGAALTVLAGTLAVRYGWTGVEAGPTERYTIGVVLWCVALGWAAATASTRWRRLLVAAVAVVAVAGFFGDPRREAIVAGSVLALLTIRHLWLPRPLVGAATVLAGASLWIYLTQWQVYPELEAAGHPVLAVLASLTVGILARQVARAVPCGVRRLRGRVTSVSTVSPFRA